MNWNKPDEPVKDEHSYDYCSVDVLVKCEDTIRNYDNIVYTVGHKDCDEDGVFWVLQHNLSERLNIIGWRYINE